MKQKKETKRVGIKYGYMRTSTKEQLTDRTQRNQLTALRNEGITDDHIYFDNMSGSKAGNRTELQKLLEIVQEGDEISVPKLDRLARNTQDALNMAANLTNKGVALNILNMGRFDDTPMGKVMFTIFSAFAEYELTIITERLQDGREWKRQNDPDYMDGRKRKLTKNQMKLMYERYKSGQETIQEIADSFGIKSRKTVYNYLRRFEQEGLNSKGE